FALLLVAFVAGCTSSSVAQSPTPSPAASPPAVASPTDQLGPGGLTLDQEIGAVMMVGFQGPATDSVLADWKQHQFGGLLLVNLNHNASSATSTSALIRSVRGVTGHRLVAATDQEGGYVCLAISTVPCAPMPVGKTDTTRMASSLHGLGFD